MNNQLNMFTDFNVEEPTPPPAPPKPMPWIQHANPDFNSFILKMYPYHKYELWFRDFLSYNIRPDRQLKDIMYMSLDLLIFNEDGTYDEAEYIDGFSWPYCYTGELNTPTYRLNRPEMKRVWLWLIEELKLPFTLRELLTMTVRDFYYYVKTQLTEEVYNAKYV